MKHIIATIIILALAATSSIAAESLGTSPPIGTWPASAPVGYTVISQDLFNRSDSGTVGGDWETEVDTTKLAITGNALVYTGDSATTALVRETTHTDTAITTISFPVKFSNITGVHTGAAGNTIVKVFNDAGTLAAYMTLKTNASGNITSYQCAVLNNAGTVSSTSEIAMTGIAADTTYDAYLYLKADASAGGVACKVGAWAEAATAYDKVNDQRGNGRYDFGATETYWAGTTPYNMTFDQVILYSGDAR